MIWHDSGLFHAKNKDFWESWRILYHYDCHFFLNHPAYTFKHVWHSRGASQVSTNLKYYPEAFSHILKNCYILDSFTQNQERVTTIASTRLQDKMVQNRDSLQISVLWKIQPCSQLCVSIRFCFTIALKAAKSRCFLWAKFVWTAFLRWGKVAFLDIMLKIRARPLEKPIKTYLHEKRCNKTRQ